MCFLNEKVPCQFVCISSLSLLWYVFIYLFYISLSSFLSVSLSLLHYTSLVFSPSSLSCENVDVNLALAIAHFLAHRSFIHLHTYARSRVRSLSLSLSLFLSFSHSLDTRTSLLLLFVLSVRSFHFFASPSAADRMIVQSFCTCSTLRGRLAVQSYLRRDSTIFILLYSKKPAL